MVVIDSDVDADTTTRPGCKLPPAKGTLPLDRIGTPSDEAGPDNSGAKVATGPSETAGSALEPLGALDD